MEGFTQKNWKLRVFGHPTEDAFDFNDEEMTCVVADGVTRDPIKLLPKVNTLCGKVSFLLKYPFPSPASVASNIFVDTFSEILENYIPKNRDENAIRVAFEEANFRIKEWNIKNIPNPDYVVNDFAGCVAAGAFNVGDRFSYGFIADSGVAVFDSEGKLKFRTENDGPDKYNKKFWQDSRLLGLDWRDPEARKIIRRDYRNNPLEENSYGVLTGEESAMHYVKTGTLEVSPRDRFAIYTDGLEPMVFSGKFGQLLREEDGKGIEELCRNNVRTEGSLVYHIPED